MKVILLAMMSVFVFGSNAYALRGELHPRNEARWDRKLMYANEERNPASDEAQTETETKSDAQSCAE